MHRDDGNIVITEADVDQVKRVVRIVGYALAVFVLFQRRERRAYE